MVAMSGQLVGEVLDGIEDGLLKSLTESERLALIVIAEKCHTATRQGSVRMERIMSVTGKSRRTVQRIMFRLRDDLDLVRVVKRGYVTPKTGDGHANVYELLPIQACATQNDTSMAQACATQDDTSIGGAEHVSGPWPKPQVSKHVPNPTMHVPNPAMHVPPMDDHHDGLNDGLNDGGPHTRTGARDPATPADNQCSKHPDGPDHSEPCRKCGQWRKWLEDEPTRTAERKCQERQSHRAAVDACPRCDELGFIDLADGSRKRCAHPTRALRDEAR